MDLRINVDKICYVIDLARRIAGKEEPIYKGGDPDVSVGNADDPGGDGQLDPIIGYVGDSTGADLETFLKSLGGDEMAGLVALALVGRGDYDLVNWEDAVAAGENVVATGQPVTMLMETPTLAEDLAAAVNAAGFECPEDRIEHGAAGPGYSVDTGEGAP